MVKKQLWYSLMLCYVMVFVVGIGLYTSLNVIATKGMEEEITKNYTAMLENLALTMDYIIDDAENIALALKEKSSVRELLFLEEELAYTDHYKFFKAIEDLAKMKSFNSYIGEIYIYYPKQNLILNGRGVYYPEIAYKVFHQGREEGYDKWYQDLKKGYKVGEVAKVADQLFYISTIATANKNNYANIVIMLDQTRIANMIEECSLAEYGYIGVVDENNKLLLANIDEHSSETVFGVQGEEKIANSFFTCIEMRSKKEQLTYKVYIPNEIFRKKISYINQVFLLFTCIFISILTVGFYLITKKYGHVRKMLVKLKSIVAVGEERQYGEIEYIEKALMGMHKQLEEDKCLIVENIMRKAIYGTKGLEDEVEQYLGEQFNISHFIVASLVLQSEGDAKQEEQLNRFIIKNIFEEMLGERYNLYTISAQKGYILVINFEQLVDEYMYEEAMHRLGVARDFLEERFNTSYVLALSDLHKEIISLEQAYDEVQKALEYRMFFSEEKVIAYNETIKEETPYLYSIEENITLGKYIKEGSTEKAIDLLNKIFRQNFYERSISLEKTKKLIAEISSALERVNYELNLGKIDSLEKINNKKNLDSIQEEMEKTICYICQEVNKHKGKAVDERIKAIIQYIEGHYTEDHLTVTSLAEEFNMKVSYISRFFKENMNENLLAYITKYRIQQAKLLLVQTELNLNDIAERVGLLNNVSLIRSFKKYEYMTPNEYRTLYKK